MSDILSDYHSNDNTWDRHDEPNPREARCPSCGGLGGRHDPDLCISGDSTIVYVAGPMTGLPDFNYPAFWAAAAELRARGFDVRCPTDNDDGSQGKPWDFYMRAALRTLVDCDEIVLLPGWEASRGARLERTVAEALGMRVRLLSEVVPPEAATDVAS